jgi:hypothetical protein
VWKMTPGASEWLENTSPPVRIERRKPTTRGGRAGGTRGKGNKKRKGRGK